MGYYDKANINLHSGKIEIATNYDGATFSDGDGTNETSILSSLESYNYENIGWFTDLSFFHSQEDEKEILTDACEQGVIDKSVVTTPRVEFTWQEVDNLDVLADMLGLKVQNVAGTIVNGAIQEVVNPSAYMKFIKIENQNGDGSAITINSVAGSTDGNLTSGTDYNVVQDGNGNYGIQLISGGTISTLTQSFIIDYDYTPNASKQMTYKVEARSIPFVLFRITECANEKGEFNVYYCVKFAITSEVQQQLVNRETTDFSGASMVFTGQKGGNYFEKKQRLTSY